MSGMIDESITEPPAGPSAVGDAPPPDLERLRAHLEESARDRDAVREEIAGLRRELAALTRRVETLEVAATVDHQSTTNGSADGNQAEDSADGGVPSETPAGAASSPSPAADLPSAGERDGGRITGGETERAADDAAVQDLRERVLRALRDRVFVAGTVGTRIELTPVPADDELQSILDRLQREPPVESAEPIETTSAGTSIRVTLRTPLRWEQFGSLLERALARQFRPGEVTWSQGAVRVRGSRPRMAASTTDERAGGAPAAGHT
jgi:hypothetical protein